MESRKGILNALKQCRFCLSQDELTSLYNKNRVAKNAVSLPLKILSCVSIEVYPSDKMPTYICSRCKYFMDIFYEFKNICRQADENILQFVENGNQLESVTWPSSLTKVFLAKPKQPEMAVMKAVVESGATVQLTTHDLSDTDMEDDENVYNIKIDDGSDDESRSARIKVITDSDKEDIVSKSKSKRGRKGHATVSKLARHVRSHASVRAYPCKYCDKTFMKSHHYTRHLRMKHRDVVKSRRGPFGEQEQQYRCDQCDDTFVTQDELIYHSAIHATQNLTCPLCQEKFADVDAVTAHIKSHVTGTEFMCDYCELIFTTKEKLDNHITVAHEDELRSEDQGESSIELDGDDDDEDDAIHVKEENGEMVVEIKKADEFMVTNYQGESEDKVEIKNSDESDADDTELSPVESVEIVKKDPKPSDVTITKLTSSTAVNKRQMDNFTKSNKSDNQTASIIRKVEEMKRKVVVQHKIPDPVPKKKEKIHKMESNNTGASDKSLRLLEKELQDLKRTNSRSEVVKAPATKNLDALKNRKPQVHTSTPKLRPTGGKESLQLLPKAIEKKIPERRLIMKENKELKEVKDSKNNNLKEDKEKEVIDKEPSKEKNLNNIKNGSSDKNGNDEVIRRSTRPSKIKDYAKMIRDSSQDSTESPDDTDEENEDDEEFRKVEKSPEPRPRYKKASIKQQPAPKPATVTTATTVPRKRGRPRKDAQQVPNKVKKEDNEEKEEAKSTKPERENANSKEPIATTDQDNDTNVNSREPLNQEAGPSTSGVLVSPTGQTLKKVPIKALPPGVKPLPLPANARLGSGEVCEMQIGKKLVKVQKIVMTKAEVEAMAKKGLVEMKDGTMVLKQGVNPAVAKSTLVGEGEGEKESVCKKDKAIPTRCDLGDEI